MDTTYCAIYTRKSTSEGLDQVFSTLDAQREAAINYIASQKSHGWVASPVKYDDGGFTGANIDRPALQQLIKDIQEHKINCVVVYKVDRLSRSLTDFAKLLEFFDKNNVTFVSVTQHFNTNSSMGRLTLNILLSFAQFERELISERTKDKMSAARKKGRWLGGVPMLGYTVNKEDNTLVIVPKEAETVREIFALYLQYRSPLELARILNKRGVVTKMHHFETGKVRGGKVFSKANLIYMLRNHTYVGKVQYGGELYDGLQKGIVSQEIFDKVQRLLVEHRVKRHCPNNTGDASLLRHVLWCANCKERLIPTYSSKHNVKYRYYVCRNAQTKGYDACPTKSIGAQDMDNAVISKVSEILASSPEFKSRSLVINTPTWDILYPRERRRVLNMLLKSVEYDSLSKKLAINFDEEGIKELEKELA